MKISVTKPDGLDQDFECASGAKVQSIIDTLSVNEQTFIVKKNGIIAHPDSVLSDGDRVELVGIIFGG
ncbi:MAG TPA: MoaD/ThiS family protein [Candidatus Norongarragalinales archaeon]|jgi:sulfur carrier protein ThiS|nr:MoaD/ThiS family protein [Candidatus Norongarragalinales archaeon]